MFLYLSVYILSPYIYISIYLKYEFILNLQFQRSITGFILIFPLSIFATSFSNEKPDSRLLICSTLNTQKVVSALLTHSL